MGFTSYRSKAVALCRRYGQSLIVESCLNSSAVVTRFKATHFDFCFALISRVMFLVVWHCDYLVKKEKLVALLFFGLLKGVMSIIVCLNFHIMKTCLYNFDPLKTSLLYSKTGVYRGIHYFFLFLLKIIDCAYSLEPPCRGGSNEYPQSIFRVELWKISEMFIWVLSVFGGEIFYILVFS